MKRVLLGSLVGLLLVAFGCNKTVDFNDGEQKISYVLGQSIGTNLQAQGLEIDENAFIQGVQDGLNDASKLDKEEIEKALTAFQKEQQEKQINAIKEAATTNKKEAAAFLAANKKKPGIKTTKSGLQYKVLKKSKSKRKPKKADTVVVHYKGTLLDGTEFDSSYKRGQPAEFPVTGVIASWTEALQLMSVGDKFKLFSPPSLAYGDRGAGALIAPGSALIFEVELKEIKSKK
jgi:FKBP-type peptidyl-prolyl cis-trans isomerase FklB